MLEWIRTEPTTVTKVGGYRTMITKTFTLPDGTVHDYVTKDAEDTHSGAVIALTNDNKVILAKQFRPGPEIIMFELPGGGIGKGETFEAGIARELEEETGYAPGRIEHLGDVYKDAYTNTQWHYYIAYDCEPLAGGQSLDSTEFIEVVKVSIEELFELSRSAKMTDSEAVLLAYETLKKIGES